MKTNLGQLIQHIKVLEDATGQAPLTRHQHNAVLMSLKTLQEGVQEVYQAARDAGVTKKRVESLEHSIASLLPETSEPLRAKLAALLPVAAVCDRPTSGAEDQP